MFSIFQKCYKCPEWASSVTVIVNLVVISYMGCQAALPTSPQTLTVLSVTETSVTLVWATVDSAESYRILIWSGNNSNVLSDLYAPYGQKPPTTTTINNLVRKIAKMLFSAPSPSAY